MAARRVMNEFNSHQLVLEATRHHQSGRLREAEPIYRKVLEREPGNAQVLHLLGVLRGQAGDSREAVDLLTRAAQIRPNDSEIFCNLGEAYRFAGRLPESIAAFRRSLGIHPKSAVAHQRLAHALRQSGHFDDAIAAATNAIALEPGLAEAYAALSLALGNKGRIDEAIVAARQAISARPNFSEAFNILGNLLTAKNQTSEAIAAYRQAIALRPAYAEAYYNLGIALAAEGSQADALEAYRAAVAIKPDYAVAWNNLGNALKELHRMVEALAAFERALEIWPESAEAHNNRGLALWELDRVDEAIVAYQRAITLKPDYPEALLNLGNACKLTGDAEGAIAHYRRAIALRPAYSDAYIDLGNALKDIGELDDAIAAYRRAMELAPGDLIAHSNLIFALYYHSGHNERTIADELRRWNHQRAEPLRKFIRAHSNDRDPDRRLRIGYVSPDFKIHPVGRNLSPLFRHHDRARFDITAYSNVPHADVVTRQFKQQVSRWRDIVGLSDEQVAAEIREDGIDILVDLALHTADNRLLVFALKPAPVQASYLAYCGSTGLETVDYRISDPFLDPAGADESCYSEKTIRLPRTYWCYEPGADPSLEVAPSPALKNGFVTFGTQNNYCKISPATWSTWAAILKGQPKSKLFVSCPRGQHRDIARQFLARAGIDQDRLHFSDIRGPEYFLCYHQIDIALDPFPFGGGTTTCDALWMGVPVVTLSGQTAVGRGGRSILSNLDLPELIAFTSDEYVNIALNLANDLDRLDGLRRNMRARLQASPLMDAAGFARDVETLYRQMWRTWCGKSVVDQ
ncbi:MAG: tetratricopeptide repeat protein [Tepidisphaeraceae bacterium]|jgi:predicted O-linked N-acetylglucosamine transferase (SPINDLY family)